MKTKQQIIDETISGILLEVDYLLVDDNIPWDQSEIDHMTKCLTQSISTAMDAAYNAGVDDIVEAVKVNQEGQFEDDGGNICWYLDDLITAITELKAVAQQSKQIEEFTKER